MSIVPNRRTTHPPTSSSILRSVVFAPAPRTHEANRRPGSEVRFDVNHPEKIWSFLEKNHAYRLKRAEYHDGTFRKLWQMRDQAVATWLHTNLPRYAHPLP